jgi:hypothetical protein
VRIDVKPLQLLWTWRGELTELLCRSISDEEDDITGEEYATGADTQEQLDNRLEIYQMLVCACSRFWAIDRSRPAHSADWRETLTGERSSLADQVGLSGAAQAAKQFTEDAEILADGSKRVRRKLDRVAAIERMPEGTPAECLRKELLLTRADVIDLGSDTRLKSMKSLATELADIRRDAVRDEEIEICAQEQRRVQAQVRER